MVTGMVCSFLFILIQLVLIVDFAHSMSERFLEKYDETEHKGWYICKFLLQQPRQFRIAALNTSDLPFELFSLGATVSAERLLMKHPGNAESIDSVGQYLHHFWHPFCNVDTK